MQGGSGWKDRREEGVAHEFDWLTRRAVRYGLWWRLKIMTSHVASMSPTLSDGAPPPPSHALLVGAPRRAGGSARALALALLALALERSLQLAFAHLTAAPVAPAVSHWPTALRRRLLRVELDASLLGRRRLDRLATTRRQKT